MQRIITLLLSLLLCVLALAGCASGEEEPIQEQPAEPAAADTSVAGLRNTTLYYITGDNYVVPVMRRIAWEEGIGKKALSCLTATAENMQSTAAIGLSTVLPESAQFELSIDDGLATLKVDSASLQAESLAKEQAMVCCIVNTLCEFPTIDRVQILPDGEEKDALEHGTDISEPISRMDLNVESAAADVDVASAQRLELYFMDQQSNVIVPVTRYLNEAPDVFTALTETVNGPADTASLKSGIPTGAQVLDAYIENGVATIDFTQQFENIIEHPDQEQAVMKTLFMLCDQFADVQSLQITVEGKPFGEDSTATLAQPVFANQAM